MAISGTVPYFSTAPVNPTEGATVVTVTGTDTGLATAARSSEGLPAFYRRCLVAFGGISGAEAVATEAASANGVIITSGQLSGLRAMQREIAFRAGDLDEQGMNNTVRLTAAQAYLALSGGEIAGL